MNTEEIILLVLFLVIVVPSGIGMAYATVLMFIGAIKMFWEWIKRQNENQ